MLVQVLAVESGLSADPAMLRRVSALDAFAVVSNSDAHLPQTLGREATCFDTDMSYFAIRDALRCRDGMGLTGTLEMYPQEEKYHLDGHRKCGVRLTPDEGHAADGLCPEGLRKVTMGVMHQIGERADRSPDKALAVGRNRFEYLIPLGEVIGAALGVGSKSKRVTTVYEGLLKSLSPNLEVLRSQPLPEIERHSDSRVAEDRPYFTPALLIQTDSGSRSEAM